jgi:hypothetical protein
MQKRYSTVIKPGLTADRRGTDTTRLVAFLQEATIVNHQTIISGSNAVFLLSLTRDDQTIQAIYKPRNGEAPLWDFPDGTLYHREQAAFLVSEMLGWHLIPPTVIRGGPYGVGTVQWFAGHMRRQNYYALIESHQGIFKRIAAFDWLVNNADRKAGHCLQGTDGRIWSIDHGLTFHTEPKLRTVIWNFAGQPIPRDILRDFNFLRQRFFKNDGMQSMFKSLLTQEEITAFRHRLNTMIDRPIYPAWSGSYRSIPWPPF